MSGVAPDGSHLYPALPYTAYAHMRADDVRDLMAYLRTLPPVRGRTPAHELSFPFTIRRLVGFWKLLFLDRSPITRDAGRSDAWNRGHYLVEALGHCAECHSSRNVLGAVSQKTRFAGGPDQEEVGFVPNITPARLGDWSEHDIADTLRTGFTPHGRRIGSPMADVVSNMAMLPESDRYAIAAYVKRCRHGPRIPGSPRR